MKKIIVFALVVALCVPALFSCDVIEQVAEKFGIDLGGSDPVADVANMYNMSTPTKVVATTTQNIGGFKLNCSYELVTGFVDNKPASVYTVTSESIRSVEDGGNNEEVKDMVISTTKKTESVEGYGSRVNGGEWDPSGSVWTIGRGRMALNLNAEYLTDVVYENNTLSFTVPAANVVQVLGEAYSANVAGDVKVVIVDDGAVITSIDLHYNLKGDEAANLVESEMTVKVIYTYDLERITLD
ncbi:MAG: hypothetical protein IJW53_01645 [Clostridia bacterium]|nr:hypothetical protein [Clostridia bacterium]